MKVVALVPLRGGSKSIPLKNIKEIAGRPLCYWSIKAAIESDIFDEIVVSTDCDQIAETVRTLFGSNIKIVARASHLATDSASTESVALDFLSNNHNGCDVICIVQVTTPQIEPQDFVKGYKKLLDENLNSIVTCSPSKRFRWSSDGKALNYNPEKRPRRQDHAGELIENGAFYFTRSAEFIKAGHRLPAPTGVLILSEAALVELDEPHDWPAVEMLLLKNHDLQFP